MFQHSIHIGAAAGVLGLLTACTGDLVSTPIAADAASRAPASGAEYQLLRRDFIVHAAWTLKSCTNGAQAPDITTDFTAALVPQRRADPAQKFRIAIDRLATGAKEVTLDIGYYDAQALGGRVIRTVNATAVDRTAQIIGAAVNIAGTVAGAAFGVKETGARIICNPDLEGHFKTRDAAKKRIAQLVHDKAVVVRQLEDLSGAAAQPLIAALLTRRRQIDAKLTLRKAELARAMDALSLARAVEMRPDWIDGVFRARQVLDVGAMAAAKWLTKDGGTQALTDDVGRHFKAELLLLFKDGQPAQAALPAGEIDGLVLRDPLNAHVFTCRGACPGTPDDLLALIAARARADQAVAGAEDALAAAQSRLKIGYHGLHAIPQAGRAVVVGLHNGPFQDNSVTLARDDDGRIVSLGYKRSAALAAALAAGSTAATGALAVRDAYVGRDQAARQAELDRLKIEKAILETRIFLQDNEGKILPD